MKDNLENNYDFPGGKIEINQELNLLNLSEEELFKPAKFDEMKSEVLTDEPYSYWKSVWRTFIKKPSAIIALVSLVLLLAGIIIIPLLTPEGYIDFNLGGEDLFPSSEHLWGTDLVGRDLFFMTWTGARKSLLLALASSAIVIFIGTLFGLAWGFFRKLDPFFVELYNLISNIPSLLIYMLLSYIVIQSFPYMPAEFRLIIALTLTGWIGIARFVRNQTIIINNREYNVASKTLGTPPLRIMIRNLLPYLLAVIITEASLTIPMMISSEVAMSFFGVGLPQQAISIGAILDLGRQNFVLYPFQLLAPALLLAYIIFTFFLLGLSLSDALDPKKHR
ncbi:ABC transporter permease [Mycoplasmatota bacterium]|nr:ABC transporter permease [Mycoplasmatota bacterium]